MNENQNTQDEKKKFTEWMKELFGGGQSTCADGELFGSRCGNFGCERSQSGDGKHHG